jgi:RNA polymerase sigma-70 factor (ECF subfamily)
VSQILSSAEQSSLVERIVAGDADAEAEFAHLFWRRLQTMLLARIGDREAARDLAQEALMAALTGLRRGALRDAERLAAFVHGVGRNVANNYLRRKLTAPELVAVEPDSVPAPSPSYDFEEHDQRLLAKRALAVLAAGEREILTLTLVEGLKPGEIAVRLNETADVIRTRKSRAVKKVAAEIQRLSLSRFPGRHH